MKIVELSENEFDRLPPLFSSPDNQHDRAQKRLPPRPPSQWDLQKKELKEKLKPFRFRESFGMLIADTSIPGVVLRIKGSGGGFCRAELAKEGGQTFSGRDGLTTAETIKKYLRNEKVAPADLTDKRKTKVRNPYQNRGLAREF